MAKISTCKICGKEIQNKEDKFKISNKTYCKHCYDKEIIEVEARKKLIDDLCTMLELKAPTGLILKQIKECKETLHYTYRGMNYTLWYYTVILNKQIDVKFGIAFMKYYYKEAEDYYLQIANVEKSVDKTKDIQTKIKIVKVNSNKNDKELLIDLNKFCEGVEGV